MNSAGPAGQICCALFSLFCSLSFPLCCSFSLWAAAAAVHNSLNSSLSQCSISNHPWHEHTDEVCEFDWITLNSPSQMNEWNRFLLRGSPELCKKSRNSEQQNMNVSTCVNISVNTQQKNGDQKYIFVVQKRIYEPPHMWCVFVSDGANEDE